MANTDKRKRRDDRKPQPRPDGGEPPGRVERLPEQAPPAEERGERIDTGKTIARGGKTTGHVPGATEQRP